MPEPSERQVSSWTRRIREGDVDAFTAVYDAFHLGLIRFAVSITSDTAAAYDCLQDAFVRLWERRHTLDPDRSIRALLFRMIYHRALKHSHREKRLTPVDLDLVEDEATNSEPGSVVDVKRLRGAIEKLIAQMPDRRREVFQLSRFSDLSHAEIAEVLDISPRTVNNHIVAALRTLRNELDRLGYTYERP